MRGDGGRRFQHAVGQGRGNPAFCVRGEVISPPSQEAGDIPQRAPIILFGAFDRHNLGDLLFPHVVAQMHGEQEVVFAGLVDRDLRGYGGHEVIALPRLAADWERQYGDAPAHLVHVGGEILSVDAWQAAVMLLPPDEARGVIALLDNDVRARQAWARQYLATDRIAPYVAAKRMFRRPGRFSFYGVGGVEFDRCDAPLRAEVLDALRAADVVGVRDRRTLSLLQHAGVRAQLFPDPAIWVATLFGDRIRQHATRGEPVATRDAFPQGYLVLQFGADFGDDATLATLAGEIDRLLGASDLGVVFFRAGAAPWHDDTECYRRMMKYLSLQQCRVFESLDIWDISALIGSARACCASSLHVRIVADGFGVPAVSLVRSGHKSASHKVVAYLETWAESGADIRVVGDDGIADAVLGALDSRGQHSGAGGATHENH